MTRKRKGFTLIELVIVIAIILIIAAIAIPNLLKSRSSANEVSALGTLRTINTAEVEYSSLNATGFGTLDELAKAHLISQNIATGDKSGYRITIKVSDDKQDYAVNADPDSPNSGTMHFFTDPTGVLRVSQTQAATTSDPPIGN